MLGLRKMNNFLQKTIRLKLILENRFNEKYMETIDIDFSSMEKCGNNLGVNLFPQNYTIKKCIIKEKP